MRHLSVRWGARPRRILNCVYFPMTPVLVTSTLSTVPEGSSRSIFLKRTVPVAFLLFTVDLEILAGQRRPEQRSSIFEPVGAFPCTANVMRR